MKKLFCLILALMALALLFLCPIQATAEAIVDTAVSAPTEPVTWEYLITVAGASLMTLLIVQYIKAPLDKIWKLPTAFVAYVIALAILVAAHAMTHGMDMNTFLLCLLNAFIAATSAMGMYEKSFKKFEKME